ncbi:magnesium transporter [Corynebacterium guangdongense]|uniref:Magnesium transporter MgtE n=1 Tax=Corynebacterium guangdongense TaxID=1783348 RepID=A0ABU2A0Y6_9CORY|nr:magnesium transporter [Corynebacterium guangdongense]MDR7330760.1 magnesium transporter [Corynebacterium guangdongense]WJZ16775.1 Magnesium transporter MgtE [Corynebacterium guangdongense]
MTSAQHPPSPNDRIVRARRDLDKFLRDPDPNPERAEDVAGQLATLPLSEVIDILERSTPVRAALVLRMLPRARAILAFDALDAAHQSDLVGALSDDAVSDYFGAMEPDDRVSLLDELPAEIAQRLLHSLDERDKDTTSLVLGYEKNSIGRHMSPDVPMIRAGQTVGEALASLRAQNDHVETIYTVPVVTSDHRLVGVTSLRTLFTADEDVPVVDLMSEPISATTSAEDEETARRFLALDLLALPVVDDSGRLVGILSNDDAFDIVEDADDEDTARSGAAEPLRQPYLTTPVWRLVRSRVVWLAVLALSGLLTVTVLDTFEDALASAVVLSLFIPLLTGTGGNTGNQAATTITRALALGDVRRRDVFAVMWREARAGLLLGLLLGGTFSLLLGFFYGPQIGLILGLTLLIVCTLAATVGGAMPILAKAIGADPAVFSNPFITTFVDAAGLIIYFLIAKAVLGI